jgi:hypothetical protein
MFPLFKYSLFLAALLVWFQLSHAAVTFLCGQTFVFHDRGYEPYRRNSETLFSLSLILGVSESEEDSEREDSVMG